MAGNILLGIGAVVFAIGYFRKSRNVMLLGAIVLVIGAGFEDLVKGGIAGYKEASGVR